MEFAKNSFFTPQVPSCPEQRSTVVTSVPGTILSISCVRRPMFCTRR